MFTDLQQVGERGTVVLILVAIGSSQMEDVVVVGGVVRGQQPGRVTCVHVGPVVLVRLNICLATLQQPNTCLQIGTL